MGRKLLHYKAGKRKPCSALEALSELAVEPSPGQAAVGAAASASPWIVRSW